MFYKLPITLWRINAVKINWDTKHDCSYLFKYYLEVQIYVLVLNAQLIFIAINPFVIRSSIALDKSAIDGVRKQPHKSNSVYE